MRTSGVLKNKYDTRDLSFERTLGSVSPINLPDEYNADRTGEFPDQNKDGFPNGCTGYTQNDLGQNEFDKKFDPAYVYNNTLSLANLPPHSPCQLRDSFKAVRLWGLQPREGGDALEYKRGAYFDVDKVNGSYFEGVRSALWLNRQSHRTVSVATPWFWSSVTKSGIMRPPKKYEWKAGTIGHNYEIVGWKKVEGEIQLIVKPWGGTQWGDGGYGYISKEIFDNLLKISGTAMYTQANWRKEDAKSIKLDLQEFILSLLRRWGFL